MALNAKSVPSSPSGMSKSVMRSYPVGASGSVSANIHFTLSVVVTVTVVYLPISPTLPTPCSQYD